MTDWTALQWLTALAALATIVGVVMTGHSIFQRRKSRQTDAGISADASLGANVVSDSPQTTVVLNSPGATVVHGDITNSMLGYSVEDHERIVGERERQLREDLERAHRAEVDALLKRIEALEEPDYAPGAVGRVYAALSAQNYELAQSLLAALEETEIQANVHLALGAQVRIRNLRAETSLLSGDPGAAAEHYETAASLVESFQPGKGAHHRNAAALRLSSYAERFGGDGVARAIELYRANLKHWPREDYPGEWAGTQRNLANSYLRLSQRTDEKAFDYLAKAEEAFGAALEVHTRESHAAEWAADQFNLGAAYLSYARRLGGQRSTRLLEAGLKAIRAALQDLSREHDPSRWATAQHNLGAGLADQGQRQGGGSAALESFAEAVQAFRAAISVRTPDADPVGWYSSQSNLGAVFVFQAQLLGREAGTSQLLQAIAILRQILDVARESLIRWVGLRRR